MTQPISRFEIPNLRSLPPDIQEMIRAVQEKSGFVPNIFLALAHRPAEFRAFFAYHDALMEKDEGLSKAEREIDRSFRPERTNDTTSLRADSGRTKSGSVL